jgi:hypothetical protein
MQQPYSNIFKVCSLIFLVSILSVFIFKSTAISDSAGNPYSGKNSNTIGAWYDEMWQASGFYRTKITLAGDSLVYGYTNTASTSGNPTLVMVPLNSDPLLGTNARTGTSVSSDMVVTEWKVTGHLHFKSGL